MCGYADAVEKRGDTFLGPDEDLDRVQDDHDLSARGKAGPHISFAGF